MNYTLSLPVALAALLLSACSTTLPSPTKSLAPPARLVLVSIDGLRADMLDPGITPHLSRIAHDGVRAQWMNPSYPSLTFPNHYTLVTGLRPDHHGIVHNRMSDPTLGQFKLGNMAAIRDARWWGGQPIWVGAENAGVRSATWAWPGSEAPIQGVQPSQWQLYDGKVPAPARVQRVLEWLRQRGPQAPRLMTLYFDQADHAGHDYGPDSPEYLDAVKLVDTAIGQLLAGMAQQGALDDTNLIVVSDHGMATVAPDHVVAIEDMVPFDEAEVVSIGQSIGIEPRPGEGAKVEARLLGAHPNYACWRKQQLPARWHYGSNPRIPSIVCQMSEGWDAMPANEIPNRAGHTRGSHGFDPALPSMRAVFVARGPDFAQGKVLPAFDNVDVYPLLTRLLQIPAAANDGNPRTLLPALNARANAAGQ